MNGAGWARCKECGDYVTHTATCTGASAVATRRLLRIEAPTQPTYQAHADAPREGGEVTSWNDRYVFVLFRGAPGSKACRPDQLTHGSKDGAS